MRGEPLGMPRWGISKIRFKNSSAAHEDAASYGKYGSPPEQYLKRLASRSACGEHNAQRAVFGQWGRPRAIIAVALVDCLSARVVVDSQDFVPMAMAQPPVRHSARELQTRQVHVPERSLKSLTVRGAARLTRSAPWFRHSTS